MKIVLECKKK